MTKQGGVFFLVGLFLGAALPAFAEGKVSSDASFRLRMPLERPRDITRPQTPEEVLSVYQWLVNPTDGITQNEAYLIAQREMVLNEKDSDYDLYKPKVLWENEKEWGIRFPAKFSLVEWDPTMKYVFCVDKTTGAVTCERAEQDAKKP